MIGVEIKTVKVFDYHVDGLYIKLDKKLILKADKISLPQRKENPSFDRIDETFKSIKYLLTFFKHITLKEIDFSNNKMEVIFHNNILQLSSKDYLIRGNIEQEENLLKGDVPILYLKKQNITMKGSFSYDLHKDVLTTKGTFAFHRAIGTFSASKVQKDVVFSLKSDTFSDLKSIIEKFSLSPAIESWAVEKVQAKSYKLLSFKGKGKVGNEGFHLDAESLKGKALLTDVKIQFQEALAPIEAERIIINYHDYGLYFDLYHPQYLGKSLDGSLVSIMDLGKNSTSLVLNLKTNAPLDADVLEILKAYDITMPVSQKNGYMKAEVDIDIGLIKHTNHVKVNVDVNESDIYLFDTKMHVLDATIKYENDKVSIENMRISEKAYKGTLSGTLNLKKKEGKFVFDANKIIYKKEGNIFFKLAKVKLPFSFSYAKEWMLQVPKGALTIQSKGKDTLFTLKDLNVIKPYITDKMIIDNGGYLKVRTKDFKTYRFTGALKRSTCFLYEKNERCETSIPIAGTATSKNLDFYALGKRIHFNEAKSRVDIDNINIDLKKFIENIKH